MFFSLTVISKQKHMLVVSCPFVSFQNYRNKLSYNSFCCLNLMRYTHKLVLFATPQYSSLSCSSQS